MATLESPGLDADTEAALLESLTRWLADHVDPSAQARADLPPAAPPWRALATDLGLLGVGVPESLGGLGGGDAALLTQLRVLQTLGAALAAEPYRSSALLAGAALRGCADPAAAELLAVLAAGEALVAWAHAEAGHRGLGDAPACRLERHGDAWRLHGRKTAVPCGEAATQVLVSAVCDGEPVLVLVDARAAGQARQPQRMLDAGAAADWQFDATPVRLRLGGAEVLQRLLELDILSLCIETVGLSRRLIDDSVQHLRTRTQFGQALAAQPVLQHRLADMHIAHVQAEALAWSTARGFHALDRVARAQAVSSAKVAANRACEAVGQGAVQLHGAMGVTEELAAGRAFRRTAQIALLGGSTRQHLLRLDALTAGATDGALAAPPA